MPCRSPTACDFKCSFGARNQPLRSIGEVDCGFFERIVPEMKAAGVEAGLDSLDFSLNDADEAQFTRIAQVKASLFDSITENCVACA